MTQKEIDVVSEIILTIHGYEYFGPIKERINTDKLMFWVSQQLTLVKTYTIPVGAKYLHKVDKGRFDEYWDNKCQS